MKFFAMILGLALFWYPFSEFYGVVEIFDVSLTVYVVVVLALFVIAFTVYSFGPTARLLTLQDVIVVMLCFTFICSTLLAKKFLESGYLTFHGVIIPAVSYFVVKAIATDKQRLSLITSMALAGMTIFCALSFVLFISYKLLNRVNVFERDAIAQATFAMIVIMTAMYNPRIKTVLRILVTILAAGALIASLTRSYLALALLSPFLVWILRRGYGTSFMVLFLLGSLAATLSLVADPEILRPGSWNPKLENSLERLINPEYWKFALYGRIKLFQFSIQEFAYNPLFGSGLRVSKGFGTTVHNFHLEWLEYGGVFAYALYSSMFVIHFRRVSKIAREEPQCAINLALIIIILANALTNGFMHGVMPYVTFILMGLNEAQLAIIKGRQYEKSIDEFSSKERAFN